MVTSVGSTGSTSSSTTASTSKNSIDTQEFLKIIIQELQMQDPTEPTSSKDLVNQMAQIRSIQSNMDLSSTLKDLSLNQKLASAGNMIGKMVAGKDAEGNDISGLVTSVKREGDTVYLELDTGKQLSVENVLTINLATAQTTTTESDSTAKKISAA